MGTEIEEWLKKRADGLQPTSAASRPSEVASSSPKINHVAKSKTKRPNKQLLVRVSAIVFFVAAATALTITMLRPNDSLKEALSPVPLSVQKAVPFDIYYPAQAKLPFGYTLDSKSFTGNNQAAVYSVSYENNKRIVFTVQKKPSDSDMKTFYTNTLPLRSELNTDVGTVSIGVLNNQSFASLPTKTNAWVLVTAPTDINQEQFNKVLKAISK